MVWGSFPIKFVPFSLSGYFDFFFPANYSGKYGIPIVRSVFNSGPSFPVPGYGIDFIINWMFINSLLIQWNLFITTPNVQLQVAATHRLDIMD